MSHGTSGLPPSTSPDSLTIARVSSNPKSRKAHPTFHFVAGLGSGVSSAVLLQPADLLKTRVQQSRSSALLPVLRSILSGPHPIHTLWRGTVPSALRTGFGSALYFTTLSTLRQIVANNAASTSIAAGIVEHAGASSKRGGSSSVLPKLSVSGNLITGATARVLAGLALMPVTVIKVRYESDFYAYKSLSSATTSIYKTEGVKGFFSGFGATAVRDAPYAGLYVVFYEGCKTSFGKLAHADSEGSVSKTAAATVNAASGVVAAGTATAITNPFDAVKTRLQLMPQKYQNMVKAAAIMIKEDGVKSFFDGLGLRIGRKAVSSALVWTVYEELISRAEKSFFVADDRAKSAATL